MTTEHRVSPLFVGDMDASSVPLALITKTLNYCTDGSGNIVPSTNTHPLLCETPQNHAQVSIHTYTADAAFIDGSTNAMLTHSILHSRDRSGHITPLSLNNALCVEMTAPLSAFGEVLTCNPTPVMQESFSYDYIDPRVWITATSGSGSAGATNSMMFVTTGTTTESTSRVDARKRVTYHAGQGVLVRFTAVFTLTTEPTAVQRIGIGNDSEGFFFGYANSDFCIIHRNNASGVATETVFPKTQWNGGESDGFQELHTLDPTKGNVFQIRYQYLGFGMITFSIENPVTGRFVIVHRIVYSNRNVVPSLEHTSQRAVIYVSNGSSTESITIKTASFAVFSEGMMLTVRGNVYSASSEIAAVSTLKMILAVRAKTVFQGKAAQDETLLKTLSLATAGGNKPVLFKVLFNPTLVSPGTWTAVHTNSVMEYCTSAASVTGGVTVLQYVVTSNGNLREFINEYNLFLISGDVICITAETTGSASTVSGVFVWNEDR